MGFLRKENMNEQMKEKHVHIEILHHVSYLSIGTITM